MSENYIQNSVKVDIGEYDIIWLGISAKKNKHGVLEPPLSSLTKSGKIIDFIDRKLTKKTYRMNLVNFAPVDSNNKLRYPNKDEIACGFEELKSFIDVINPKIIILLGDIVRIAISNHMKLEIPKCDGFDLNYVKKDNIFLVSAYHPSYIAVYKQDKKELYCDNICKCITNIYAKMEKE